MDDGMLRNKEGLTEAEFLQRYDASKYERPSVTVDMLIFTAGDEFGEDGQKKPRKALKLLMIKRGDHPCLGRWALPGGFVNADESVDAAACRELQEETGLENVYMEQIYTWGDLERDPRTRIISCSYMALADSIALDVKAGDDAAEACWFDVRIEPLPQKKQENSTGFTIEQPLVVRLVNEKEQLTATVNVVTSVTGRTLRVRREMLDSPGIAFDHARMIEYAVTHMRKQIETTDRVLNLMPETFTMEELRQVYEAILGYRLQPDIFRHQVAEWVMEAETSMENIYLDKGEKRYRARPKRLNI